MTEQELLAIEIRAAATNPDRHEEDWQLSQAERASLGDVLPLVAEVRRLQGLIKQAEWSGSGAGQGQVWEECPWCRGLLEAYGDQPAGHTPTCPAFGHSGETA